MTIPQIGGMYRGDRSRKETLVEFGFRLPSALDNRPLNFEEWEGLVNQAMYVSATPGDYELRKSGGLVVEQLIRPTGLVDPEIEVRKAGTQVDDLLEEIRQRVAVHERVLVTCLTKKMAEDLTDYYQDLGVRVRYLHSDIETIERVEIIRSLRKGEFDVLVGINLLREGLDLPEVSLVAILDADKEGFLRSARSLIQTIGRAARNLNGKVIMYADAITDSMRRRSTKPTGAAPSRSNTTDEHGITPTTIIKAIDASLVEMYSPEWAVVPEIDERPGQASEESSRRMSCPDRITRAAPRDDGGGRRSSNTSAPPNCATRSSGWSAWRSGWTSPRARWRRPNRRAALIRARMSAGATGTKATRSRGPANRRCRSGARADLGAATGAARKPGRLKLVPDRPE